jgi:hypothetical protein
MAKVAKLKAVEAALSAALTPEAQTPEEREETHEEMVEDARKAGLLFYSNDLDPMLTSMDEVLVHVYRLSGSVAQHMWKPESVDQTLRLGILASMLGRASDHVGHVLERLLTVEQLRAMVKANPQVVQGLVAAYGPEPDDLGARVEARAASRVGN